MAGDRRATMGNVIASRHIEKVFPADMFSVLGIAGSAGIALDITRLFQVELEHYEKIEGMRMSLDGKANHSVGSGSVFARGALKKLWKPNLGEDDAVKVAVEALYDAADDDSATGGPDVVRQLWPVVYTVNSAGARRIPERSLAEAAEEIIASRSVSGREA